MNTRKQKSQKTIEATTATTYRHLQDAKSLAKTHLAAANLIARTIWPLVVFHVHKRLTPAAKSHKKSPTDLITSIRSSRSLDSDLVDRMTQANIVATMGSYQLKEIEFLIDTAIEAMDSTESRSAMKRRLKAGQASNRRLALSRWASAACGLLCVWR